jgi:hypothetical protein
MTESLERQTPLVISQTNVLFPYAKFSAVVDAFEAFDKVAEPRDVHNPIPGVAAFAVRETVDDAQRF